MFNFTGADTIEACTCPSIGSDMNDYPDMGYINTSPPPYTWKLKFKGFLIMEYK